MSDHLKEMPPAAQLLGREIVSVDPHSGEVKLRFAARTEFANRHGTVQGGMLAAMLDSAKALILSHLDPAQDPDIAATLKEKDLLVVHDSFLTDTAVIAISGSS